MLVLENSYGNGRNSPLLGESLQCEAISSAYCGKLATSFYLILSSWRSQV
jgi:hypothetical protein